MDEAAWVLQVILDELTRHGTDSAGQLVISDGLLLALDSRVRLSVVVHRDPDAHPALAHCHVLAEIGVRDQSARLDTCVVGIHSEREQALAEAARIWVVSVAGPVFSVAHAKPVLGAAHFDGTDVWGVIGCHGFVGPVAGRLVAEQDLAGLQKAPLFDCAAELAPPGLVHIAKVTLQAEAGGTWQRNLEIDGHQTIYSEKRWNAGPSAPANAIASRFAVFHYADQTGAIQARRRVDDAIRQFVSAFQETDDLENVVEMHRERGVDAELVHKVAGFVPLVFGRLALSNTAVPPPTEFTRIRQDGSIEEGLKLMREPVFARATALSRALAGEFPAAARKLAMASPELNAINNALNAGSKLENLVLSPTVIPDSGVSPAAIEAAHRQQIRLPRQTPASPKPAKPWWRFWQ